MRSMSKMVLCALLAVFAMSALAVASASAALPEFEGPFPNKIEISTKQYGEVVFESGEGLRLTCTHGATGEGTITASKALTVKFALKECSIPFPNRLCTTKGAAEGEVRTEELKSALVYISKSSKEVGIDFDQYVEGNKFPPPPVPTFAKFKCGGGGIEPVIRDSVIANVTALNHKTRTYTLKFSQERGKQKPTWYENEKGGQAKALLEVNWLGSQFERLGLQAENNLETAKETEIKA